MPRGMQQFGKPISSTTSIRGLVLRQKGAGSTKGAYAATKPNRLRHVRTQRGRATLGVQGSKQAHSTRGQFSTQSAGQTLLSTMQPASLSGLNRSGGSEHKPPPPSALPRGNNKRATPHSTSQPPPKGRRHRVPPPRCCLATPWGSRSGGKLGGGHKRAPNAWAPTRELARQGGGAPAHWQARPPVPLQCHHQGGCV